MAKALEGALSEFQLKVEELIIRGDIKFDHGSTALKVGSCRLNPC